MCFDGRRNADERPIHGYDKITDLQQADLDKLSNSLHWLSVTGSFRFEDSLRLYDISLALYPTFDTEQPVCFIAHLDAALYTDLWNDHDHLNADAAERLRTLSIALGAHEGLDGFYTTNIDTFSEAPIFDGATLRKSFLEPTSVRAAWENRQRISHGLVSGIKRSLVTLEQMRERWGDGELFETITGHVILSCLVDIDESFFDDED
ncbi:hypothetical protein ENSA5_70100 [Enhygromyxa salina]|uniref:Uncharacterized protein n=1 Tax=Enhygromyxa salina TaxID=215803 RepID=A0A2S9XAM7_9BACT|nr:hypothetical protein [Enhygromyxa salina]PRP89903.1 hypothetical protein ENSA5_70100 [Enhygromyxa salina]